MSECFIVPPIALSPGVNVTTNVPASSYAAYNVATTYAKDAFVVGPISADGLRYEYQSVQANNVGKSLDDKLWWTNIGTELRARMFDKSVGSITSLADKIIIEIDAKKILTTIALLNIVAKTVKVTMTDPVEGVIPLPVSLVTLTDPGNGGWWNWHFQPIERETRALIDNIPAYSQAKIKVEIDNTGGVASVGVLIAGYKTVLGTTQYGASVGIDDYSVKQRDAWGGYTVQERDFSEVARLQVFVEDAMVDRLPRFLAKYRATACFYVGTPLLKSTWLYGFFSRFDHVFSEFEIADCSIEIESVT